MIGVLPVRIAYQVVALGGVALAVVALTGPRAWKAHDFAQPGFAGLHAVLELRLHFAVPVERADGHRNPWPRQRLVDQWRSAVAAEAAFRVIGTPEQGQCPARDTEIIRVGAGERTEEIAELLLAHPAVAKTRIVGPHGELIANCATLASTLPEFVFHFLAPIREVVLAFPKKSRGKMLGHLIVLVPADARPNTGEYHADRRHRQDLLQLQTCSNYFAAAGYGLN